MPSKADIPVFHTPRDDRLHLFISMGVYNPREPTYLDDMRLGQLLVEFYTIAKHTGDCVIHFLYTGIPVEYMAAASTLLNAFPDHSVDFDPVFISVDEVNAALDGCKRNNIGTHSMVRIVLPTLFPDVRDGIWLDCDVITFDDLNKMLAEARNAVKSSASLFAGCLEKWPHEGVVNAGVLYMDFDRIRNTRGAQRRIIRFCNKAVENEDSAITLNMIDQDAINALGVAKIDGRWNITLHEYSNSDKPPADRGCIHFTGERKYCWSPISETEEYSFIKDLTAEVASILPGLQEKWIPAGTSSLDSQKPIPHVEGRRMVEINEPQPVVCDSAIDRVCVAYGVSGNSIATKALPVSMYSVASSSSVPVSFKVAYMPDRVDKPSLDVLSAFLDGLKADYGCDASIVPVPEVVSSMMGSCGDRSRASRWSDHMVSCFLHDVFDDVDLCLKLDVDTLVTGDVAELMKYCRDRGLGSTHHMFGCRSMWRNTFCAEFNFGVSPQSFSMVRESGSDDYVCTQMVYGRRVLSDELYGTLWRIGRLNVGMYPVQWNMVGRVRQNLSKRDVLTYQEHDVFYGKKYRVDGYVPMLVQADYRNSAKVYHFSLDKPWAVDPGKSTDPDDRLWRSYWRSASVYIPESSR